VTALLALVMAAIPAMAAATMPAAVPGAGESKPPIGWCCFYPFVDVGMDSLPLSGASILSVCSGGWGMGQVEGKIDFGPFDRQLAYAEHHDLRLAIIQEINPYYAPAWIRDRVRSAGESSWDAQDRPGATPSISSPVFRTAQEQLLARFVEHVRKTDRSRRVAFYHPGAEWWFPLNERYNPLDVAAFRRWLARRYGSIAALNRTWHSAFASFDAVDAPRIDMMGGAKGQTGLALVVDVGSGMQHCSWSTTAVTDPNARPGPNTYAAAEPGKRYCVSAWALVERMKGPGVFLEIAWVGPNGGAPVAIDQSRPVRGPAGRWQRLSAEFTAPPAAGRAWILLKFMGAGAARYDGVSFVREADGTELAPNPTFRPGTGPAPVAWSFQNWTGGAHAKPEYLSSGGHTGGACLRIEVPESGGVRPPYTNATAAVQDWSAYWFEAGAEYIDSMSAMMRRLDPTRPTVTYLTMSWAAPSEWDETQRSAVAPDVVAMKGRHIDAFGMQLCSADKDPYRVIACLDLMRKYGKPLWAVDLVDFTSGVAIGPEAMDQVTQAAVQHGAAGIVYCAWHIPTVLDYSFYPNMRSGDQAKMIRGAMEGVRAMAGMRVAAQGALVIPMLPATPDDPDGVRNDWRSFAGWYKLMERLHLTVDVVTLRELDAGTDLSGYPWVLAPDCACISDRSLACLRRYATHGGRVVCTGRFASRDDHGAARGADAPAVAHMTLPDLGREFAGDPVRDTHAGNTPPLFLWRVDTPASARALERACQLAPSALPTRAGDARVLSAPAGVRSVQWTGERGRALYLVNNGVPPASGVRVRLPAVSGKDVTVVADMKPATPRVEARSKRSVTLRIPSFRVSCIVRATEPAKDKTPR